MAKPILIVGGRGSGKSYRLCQFIQQHATPNAKIILLAPLLSQIRNLFLYGNYPITAGKDGVTYNSAKQSITFPNGATVQMTVYLERIKGTDWTAIAIDNANDFGTPEIEHLPTLTAAIIRGTPVMVTADETTKPLIQTLGPGLKVTGPGHPKLYTHEAANA